MLFGDPALFMTEAGEKLLLEWREKDLFQITVRGLTVPCFFQSTGLVGAWIHFQRDTQGHVVSLTAPGMVYGVVWDKQKD